MSWNAVGTTFVTALAFLTISGCSDPTPTSKAAIRLEVDSSGCDADHPIAVHITNISSGQLDGVWYIIRGQEAGHSTILAHSGRLVADKIMAPGEVYSQCTTKPEIIQPVAPDVKLAYTVEVENAYGPN